MVNALATPLPFDVIWFEDSKQDKVAAYLGSGEAKTFVPALEATAKLIDGFESPLGMELLATIDWLLQQDGVAADRESIQVCSENLGGRREVGSPKAEAVR